MDKGYSVENASELPMEHFENMKKAQGDILASLLDIYKAVDTIKKYIFNSVDLTDEEKSDLTEGCHKVEDKISSHLIAEAVEDMSYILGKVQRILA